MSGVVRLIDMVFPGDTNHHGTLFGGVESGRNTAAD